jgi:glucose-1-phosphate cytidylyltransferase
MKVVILAGGKGTRLSEYTESIPKPMVNIGNYPIIWHIMKIYSYYGFKEFVIGLGYKSELIKDYFLKFKSLNSDFTVDLSSGDIEIHQNKSLDWKITLVDTGLETMTGGRLKRLRNYLNKDTFMLTYGDGLANINIKSLLEFHRNHKKMVTMTAVRPPARFGELELNSNIVKSFKEKPQLNYGWINGGFFVMENKFIDYIKDDTQMLEREPLEEITMINQLMAYKHEGFWQCMDNKRDLEKLKFLWESNPPWILT